MHRKAMEMTADGIAQVAVALSLKSNYLQKTQDMVGTFWYFFDLVYSGIADMERVERGEIKRREMKLPLCIDELPDRAIPNALGRAYLDGNLTVPVQEASDEELLACPSIGVIRLAQIRKLLSQTGEVK